MTVSGCDCSGTGYLGFGIKSVGEETASSQTCKKLTEIQPRAHACTVEENTAMEVRLALR